MKLRGKWAVIFSIFLTVARLHAQNPETNKLTLEDAYKRIDEKLHYQHGEVTLPNGLAKLNLPSNFRYINPADSQFVLEKLWGNPGGDATLGMIFPSDVSPISPEAWGVVVTYTDDGHIKDADADSINYDKLLRDMQASLKEVSGQRVKDGYSSIELVGWAAPPRYDKAAHKMYWAKELKFAEGETNTLNYDIRVLGRRGVLNLNAVSSTTALPVIEKSAPEIVRMVNFTEGNRYEDFDGKTDRVAAYGLAALVAGGIAAKAGLFKVLIGILIAAKKFVVLVVIALVAFFKRMALGGKKKPLASADDTTPTAPQA